MAYSDPMATGETQGQPAIAALMASNNIAADLDETELTSIAQRAIEEYDIDKTSRKDWETRIAEAVKLAMLVGEEKTTPFEHAANIKYPLLTTAALQFNARAYPAIVQGNRVVKCNTWGNDPQGMKRARADRVAEHMSYQLLAEMPEWEEDTDKMLVILPIVGCVFRKVYYDPSLGRNCTRLVTADRMVVNYYARSMAETPRCTEEMNLYPYEIEERIRSGRFVKFDYAQATPTEGDGKDGEGKQEANAQDSSSPHLFLEQHRLLDLDEDGYPEPYVVTVHKASQTVCRIVANYSEDTVTMGQDGGVVAIRKQDYYVKYTFLPSPDGGFYGWGFGWLLADITEAINTTLNMMLDAGHVANVQGGLVSSTLGLKEKSIKLKMGEWKVIGGNMPVKDAVLPITYPGPSSVLFNLLGLLIETGRDVAAIKDVLSGEVRQNMTASATLALIEQGLQVFTSIYKRIHRSLKAELGILARLNRKHLDPEKYAAFFDIEEQQQVGPDGQPMPVPPPNPKQDYSEKDMDILPVSDPNMASRMQELAKAEFIREVAKENPTVNPFEATKRALAAAQVEDIEELMMPPPTPDPVVSAMMEEDARLELRKKEADITKTQADTMKAVASIEQGENAGNMARSKLVLDALKTELTAEQNAEKMQVEAAKNGQGRVPGMEGQPGNAAGAQSPQGDLGAGGAGLQGQPVGLADAAGGGMGEPASAGGM